MPRAFSTVVLTCLLAALTACAPNRDGSKPTQATGTPVQMIRNFAAYEDTFTDAGLQWIRSQQQLNAVGSTLLNDLRVDWEKESVLVVALGTKPTGGYGVRISEVLREKNGDIHVVASVREPGEGEPVTQVITHPIAVAVIAYNAPDAQAHLHTRGAPLRPSN